MIICCHAADVELVQSTRWFTVHVSCLAEHPLTISHLASSASWLQAFVITILESSSSTLSVF